MSSRPVSARLSQCSGLRFELQRQDALDAPNAAAGLPQDVLDAPAAGQRRDYSARLSFHARF